LYTVEMCSVVFSVTALALSSVSPA
jgi:hypothetical protein